MIKFDVLNVGIFLTALVNNFPIKIYFEDEMLKLINTFSN